MQSFTVTLELLTILISVQIATANLSGEAFDWGEETNVWKWNVKDYPDPQKTPKFCHRLSKSYVCDPDSIIAEEQADELDFIIRQVSNDTPCACPECPEPYGGLIIGVALLKTTYQPNEPRSKIIRDFAEELRKQWNFGPCDNDVLILVATKDRLSYTDVGPGITPYISSTEAHRIFIENKAHFTAGNYFEGLKSMVKNYHSLSQLIKVPTEKPRRNAGLEIGLPLGLIALLAIIVILTIIYKRRQNQSSSRKGPASEHVSSSWKRKETTWVPLSSQYKPCKTEDEATDSHDPKSNDVEETGLFEKTAEPVATALEDATEGEKEPEP